MDKTSIANRRVTRGIRFEMVVNITILVVFALILSAFVVYKLLEHHLVLQEIENVRVFAYAMRERMESWIERESISPDSKVTIQKTLDRFVLNSRSHRILVFDVKGSVIATKALGDEKTTLDYEAIFREEVLPSLVARSENVEVESTLGRVWNRIPVIRVSLPIISDNRVWGGISVSMAIKGLMGLSLTVLLYFILYMSFVTLVLAVFGRLLMNRLVIQPILSLVEGTRRIGQGDLTTQVEIQTQNELGELAESLNETTAQLRRAQIELIRNEKLATVGRLAAGVAHEIGNPIGAIVGYAEMLKGESTAEQVKDFSSRIANEAQRVDRIIRDLLGISRPSASSSGGSVLVPLTVNEAIKRTVDLVAGQNLFQGIEFSLDLGTENPEIYGDFHQFQQVLINLFTNAAHAMSSKGRIVIAVRSTIFNNFKHITYQAGDLKTVFAPEASFVEISISDTGPGIRDSVFGHLFEPFFTTLEPGRGTGLGLFIVSRVLEWMKGRISVANRSEGGAQFTLLFPRISQ